MVWTTAQLYFIGSERWAWKCIQGTLSIQKFWSLSFLPTVKKGHSHPYHWMFPSSLLITWVVLLSVVVLKTVQIIQRGKNIRQSYTFSTSCLSPSAQPFCFLRPLWGEQEKALVRDHFIVILQNIMGWKQLPVSVEHFHLVILYSAYVNVFNYSCGFALFLYSLCILCNIWLHDTNSSSQWGWCVTHLPCKALSWTYVPPHSCCYTDGNTAAGKYQWQEQTLLRDENEHQPWPFGLLTMKTEMSLSWVFIEHWLKSWISSTLLVRHCEHLSPAAEVETATQKGKK